MSAIDLFSGFAANLLITVLIVRWLYYPAGQGKNYIFTYIAFSTVIYFVMAFLGNAELSMGVGFGLFAIFSVLRYRTETISAREMTYLFVVIALPVMNSLILVSGDWPALLAANAAVIAVLFALERGWGFHYDGVQPVKYERIELIRPDKRELLLADLRQRTGLPVTRVEVRQINLLNDTADLMVYYDQNAAPPAAGPSSSAYVDERYLPAESR